MSVLRVERLKKSYGGRVVVTDVSFSVTSGQVVGLLGPNGAGKTTSFYMVIGIVSADEGEVTVDGVAIQSLPMYKRCRLGMSYLPQEASIFRKLSVEDNIRVALDAQGIKGQEADNKLESLIQEFSIDHIRTSFGYALSGGERRRVEIARSLAGDPRFLLLDEPFAGIDPIAVADIQNIIRHLKNKGIGILITDHNVRETLGICDQAFILKDGRIQVQGTAEDIAHNELAKRFYLGENFKL